MKLRNKLIPLASVFATSAILAPAVLTSCSAAGGMTDLTSGNYAITTKKARTEGNVADEELAMSLWVSSIASDTQTFIQDRYWGDAALIKGFADLASINVTSIKGLCKDVSVKYVTVKVGEVDQKIPTISMTYSLAVESNWSVTGDSDKEMPVAYYAQYAAEMGAPLYYPIAKYYYDNDVVGNIYSTYVYEATWENIPVVFYDAVGTIPKQYLPKILTEVTAWTIRPSLSFLQLMDESKLDWKYSVKYAKEDTFVYDKDGVQTSKVNGSALDRTFKNYEKLISGPTSKESMYYTNAANILQSEGIASYYLSDLAKDETK